MTEYTANIDGDLLVYEMGQNHISGIPVSLDEAKYNVDSKIRQIIEASGCDKYAVYLTHGPCNFRLKIATIKKYKGNRDDNTKPAYYDDIRSYMVSRHSAEIVHGMETDDRLAMEQRDGTVLCSRDKDLDQVQGWHYSWACGKQKERPLYQVSEVDGLRLFYTQLLTGDSSDNILGLYRVGTKTAPKKLKKCQSEEEMFKVVQAMYEHRFGTYWEFFLTENARLLWLKRSKDDIWQLPQYQKRM